MIACSHIIVSAKQVTLLTERAAKQMGAHVRNVVSCLPSNASCSYFHSAEFQPKYASLTISRGLSGSSTNASQAFQGCSSVFSFSKHRRKSKSVIVKSLLSSTGSQTCCFGMSLPCENTSLTLSLPKQEMVTKTRWKRGHASWVCGAASTGLLGTLVCFSSSKPVYAEASKDENTEKDECDLSSSHGKKVYSDFSITGIPGDGRCLFRSVAHGACVRSGKPSPNEILQKELADDLRARVADEFVRRREETEWFVEGDFDTYISQIRKPHVWGGEPELFMASHVLRICRMPITVYMFDGNAGGLISIAEYGQEYYGGKDDPIRVLYHGFGHYDALQIPGTKSVKARL
ncbi:OTU domain-containing protein At3g57810-like isoform X1 [Papaver somniferum]|uniref:OTU domain-containing protein At3g57810-like isoform X1 n=1 Tax=Papaver somniferum TaxID=3469 RepID=UPI000E6F641C|nr:OTU domain-containing protein At3g57810-like isoform X1 [Papaver somniferum]XP_026413533.1 OTU domain-containing protein At3g57810-like isoform X1 [Papaver somniferum]XP_026413535.1 OTU domain-containing protein At3g57810-like isoform X1 [Papaver somniferum]